MSSIIVRLPFADDRPERIPAPPLINPSLVLDLRRLNDTAYETHCCSRHAANLGCEQITDKGKSFFYSIGGGGDRAYGCKQDCDMPVTVDLPDQLVRRLEARRERLAEIIELGLPQRDEGTLALFDLQRLAALSTYMECIAFS